MNDKQLQLLNGADAVAISAVPKTTTSFSVDTRLVQSTTGINSSGAAQAIGSDTVRIKNSGTIDISSAGGPRSTKTPTKPDISEPYSPYYFKGTMSEEVMHRYLDKALQVQYLSDQYWTPATGPGAKGPSYFGFDPEISYDPPTNSPLFNQSYDHGKLLTMILDTGAKFVYDTAAFRPPYNLEHPEIIPWDYARWIAQCVRRDAEILHSFDPEIIYGASLMESVDPGHTGVPLPWIDNPSKYPMAEWLNLFYPHSEYPDGRIGDNHDFDFKLMQLDWNISAGSTDEKKKYSNLDLTKPEALMWWYYLSIRYIDAGCESIHFGDLFFSCMYDTVGNEKLWKLVSLIRAYGKLHARRGVVLIDTHVGPDPDKEFKEHFLYGWYHDPGATPLPNWERQLIFDFYSLGIYYIKDTSKPCFDTNLDQPSGSTIDLPVVLNPGSGFLNRGNGGLHPLGWLCSHSPFLSRLDLGEVKAGAGCDYPNSSYGYDNTSWFARQKTSIKNEILKYFHFIIKCYDPYAHFCMPGRLVIRKDSFATIESYYNAFTEAATIKNIWNGTYSNGNNWTPHYFTRENVLGSNARATSDLIFVGGDKMFFIGDDGWIHGYIWHNGAYNGGVWLPVFPTFIAYLNYGQTYGTIGGQVRAKSDLVASPDGSMLLYIGIDDYIHGFEIFDNYNYRHIHNFMKADMHWQGLTANSSLIFPLNDRIYYISNQIADGGHRVHGFQKSSGSWQTVSPSYSAVVNFGQNIVSQYVPAGALTYDLQKSRLYFRTSAGYLAYYEVYNVTDYYYVACPGNFSLVDQRLRMVGNLAIHGNRIYYVAIYNNDPSLIDSYRIHCLIENSDGSWTTNSPTYAAAAHGYPLSSQDRSDKSGQIAVSADGNTIIYFSDFYPLVNCYHKLNDWDYSYETFVKQISTRQEWIDQKRNSLHFKNSSEFFFIFGVGHDSQIGNFKFHESYCTNPAIDEYLH